MHALYPDATIEELGADNVCIVCRDEMHPWHTVVTREQRDEGQEVASSERKRPKKLPCGHILHFQCLRSWLERQQACPTCRRSVLERPAPLANGHAHPARQQNQQQQGGNNAAAPAAPPPAPAPGAAPNPNQQRNARHEGRRPNRDGFNFRFGPIRVYFGRLRGGDGRYVQIERANQGPTQNAVHNAADAHQRPAVPSISEIAGQASSSPGLRHHIIHTQLNAMEAQLNQEIALATVARDRVVYLRRLQDQIDHARGVYSGLMTNTPFPVLGGPNARIVVPTDAGATSGPTLADTTNMTPNPSGVVTLPDGWRLVPLQAMPSAPQIPPEPPVTVTPLGQMVHSHFAAAAARMMQEVQNQGGFPPQQPNQGRPNPHSAPSVPHTPHASSPPRPATTGTTPTSQPQSAAATASSITQGPVTSTLTVNSDLVAPANGSITPPVVHVSSPISPIVAGPSTSAVPSLGGSESWSFGNAESNVASSSATHTSRQPTVEDATDEDVD